jgi:putative membrane protein
MKAPIIIGALWLLVPMIEACGRTGSDAGQAGSDTSQPVNDAGNAVSDAQIASIVVTANQVDIDAGKLAVPASRNADVKAFAQRMITDHTSVIEAATGLATRLQITPQDNPTSQSLKAGGDKSLAELRGFRDAAFDKAYIDREVAYHTQVISALDSTLIPGATNPELKALLIKARPTFIAHLEEAKRVQSALARQN